MVHIQARHDRRPRVEALQARDRRLHLKLNVREREHADGGARVRVRRALERHRLARGRRRVGEELRERGVLPVEDRERHAREVEVDDARGDVRRARALRDRELREVGAACANGDVLPDGDDVDGEGKRQRGSLM